jgi:hypothetical protein
MQAELYFNSGGFQELDIKSRKILVLMSSLRNVKKKGTKRGFKKAPKIGVDGNKIQLLEVFNSSSYSGSSFISS